MNRDRRTSLFINRIVGELYELADALSAMPATAVFDALLHELSERSALLLRITASHYAERQGGSPELALCLHAAALLDTDPPDEEDRPQ